MPELNHRKTTILIFDEILTKKTDVKTRRWLNSYPLRYAVRAGESLKDHKSFPRHISKIVSLVGRLPRSEIRIVAVGGGSVGDFAGFAASVLKRGVPLIHIPSTWLAAIDSAHGGKNALNVDGLKNQVGTFYPAQDVWLVKSLLQSQETARAYEAWGEVLKMALLVGGKLFKQVSRASVDGEQIWQLLPILILAKNKIVARDPHETNGIRYLLNLGHTLGHAIESELKMAHGLAVMHGLSFSIHWSYKQKLLKEKEFHSIYPLLLNSQPIFKRIKNAKRYLSQDKKMSQRKKINFIFLKSPGHPVILPVKIQDILRELKRQAAL